MDSEAKPTNRWIGPPVFSPSMTPSNSPSVIISSAPSTALRSSQVVRDFLEGSTVHGILDLTRPTYGTLWKVVWLIVIIGFSAMSIFNIEQVLEEFVENPTTQNYREESSIRLPLPDVSVCTHAVINASACERMGASEKLMQQVQKNLLWRTAYTMLIEDDPQGNAYWQNDPAVVREYEDLRIRHDNLTYDQLLRTVGAQCEGLIQTCLWGHPCCRTSTPYLDLNYGQCYRFHTGRVEYLGGPMKEEQEYPGLGGGTQIILRQPSDMDRESAIRGAMVEFIHPNESAAFIYSQIPFGVNAVVQLSLQTTQRINTWRRPNACLEDKDDAPPSDASGLFPLASLRRSSNGCFYSMWSLAVQKFCNCTLFPNIAEIRLCEPFDKCPYQHQPQIIEETRRQQVSCIPQCTRRSFSTSITYSHFDTRAFCRKFNLSCSIEDETSGEDLIVLDIYYAKMEYLRVTEVEVYSIMTLVSNIGGVVGLWLGASLMSILQLIFYFAKWLSIRYNNCSMIVQ